MMHCFDCKEEDNLKPTLRGNFYTWECLNCGSIDIGFKPKEDLK